MDKKLNVASLCFEAMLAQIFHIYAGGLGVVQAGLLKSAGRKEWPVNLYGLGILWKKGYYEQKIGPQGMIIDYATRRYDFVEDTGVRVEVVIRGKPNFIKVWHVKPEIFGTAPLFLLDTDIEENDGLARSNTSVLYAGNEETRLAQEIILGIGGVRAFKALGIPIDVWHGHEGHAVLAAVELLRENLKSCLASFFPGKEAVKKLSLEEKKELREKAFAGALEIVRKQFVFTTHTPELAGNEMHSMNLMIEMGCFPGIPKELVSRIGGSPFDRGMFNMTVGGFRFAKISNAVSKLHLETARQMWHGIDGVCPLISVTNGVDEDWQFPEFLRAVTSEALQLAKMKHKGRLIKYVEKRTGKKFKEDVLTIVFARRQTDYKRPWLMFMDWPWLKKLLQDGKIQLIIAGKPHPHDRSAIIFFNWLHEKSLENPNLAVLAGYERQQSKILKAGADVWLFTSRRPREACSTSGMSAALDGALNFASRDGWYDELSDEYYFPFGVTHPCREGEQDTLDFQDFQRVLENEIMPMYYNDKAMWYKKALSAKQFVEKNFCSDRMLKDYIDKMYLS